MPSEERLHPASIFFVLVAQVRGFALPLLFALVGFLWAGFGWQLWALPFAGLYVMSAVLRYLSFRYRYEPNEIVIRSGFIFRNERHVPYARIQNLDAVQNVFHRLFGVVEVRVETGGGTEPEAKMSVLPVAAFEEMRRRVFSGRREAPSPSVQAAVAEASGATASRALLHLPVRELVLLGLVKGRGGVLIGAAFGLLWELGFWNGFSFWPFGDGKASKGVIRSVARWLFDDGALPIAPIALAVAALVGLLLLIRVFSVIWTIVRLHGFRLTLSGEDLRTEFGLLTRVTATIPVRRIQTLTIQEGPLARRLGRATVRVDTAGGTGGEGEEAAAKQQREWLAPIIRRSALPDFVRTVIPELDLAAVTWRPAHPRAYRREVKGWLLICLPITIVLAVFLRWWALVPFAVLVAWAFFAARRHVAHMGWAVTDNAVLYRSGWLWRQISVARFAKIQAVALHESPFDRRNAMARVRVDTAGAGDLSHRVDIPYLGKDAARELHGFLAAQAAGTELRW